MAGHLRHTRHLDLSEPTVGVGDLLATFRKSAGRLKGPVPRAVRRTSSRG